MNRIIINSRKIQTKTSPETVDKIKEIEISINQLAKTAKTHKKQVKWLFWFKMCHRFRFYCASDFGLKCATFFR